MKILFVDESSNLQEKWIEPLRGEGWGVIRAQSAEDAEKIFEFHGDSLSNLIVSESHVEWAEKWKYPYVVLIKAWKEAQVVKHQNYSSHPAIAYLDYDSSLELLKQAISESAGKKQNALKATGTEARFDQTQDADVISFAKKPNQQNEIEKTLLKYFESTKTQLEIRPEIEIKSEADVQPVIEIQAQEPVAQDNDRTMMLDTTSLSQMNLSSSVMDFINEKPEFIDEIEELPPVEQLQEMPEIQELPKIEESYSMQSSAPGNKDLETMKSYLALREQDVALLTGQMRSAQERVQQLEAQLKTEKARSSELHHMVQKQEQQINDFDRDKQIEFEVLYGQVEDLNLQLRERTDKVRTIEAKLKVTTDEVEKVKERVRVDIRRIRVREKELESQLEILKKDSTALLVARDEKILELKRKIDLLEFNMELVQEQYGKERNQTEQLRHKLKEAASAMKRAGGLLDSTN